MLQGFKNTAFSFAPQEIAGSFSRELIDDASKTRDSAMIEVL
jgi:hypothetical protein